MRRLLLIGLSMILLLCLAGCGQNGADVSDWQEQYDLGMRYLSELDYENAVIAFAAAIEVDPKQPEAYLGLAEAYVGLGDYGKAAEAVRQGIQACGGSGEFDEMLDRIAALQSGTEDPVQSEADAAAQSGEDDDGGVLNAYGATKFEYRGDYLDFSAMTPEQQQIIETAGNAAIANNTAALYEILDTVSVSPFQNYDNYTVWNGYKVNLHFAFSSYEADDGLDQSGDISITLRPENGEGYYVRVYSGYGLDESGDYYYNDDQRIICPCADWQWNGMFDRIEHWRGLRHVQQEGVSIETTETHSESGGMLNNLRNGICTRTKYNTQHVEMFDDIWESTETYTEVYQNGTMVESDDKFAIVPKTNVGLEGFSLGEIGEVSDEQSYLDELFW